MRSTILFFTILIFATTTAFSQTSAFTYQGSLNDTSNPANGTYQMRFTLFNVGSGGNPVGSQIEIPSVQVADGLFSVSLDFGAAVYDGSNRFLQVEVRRNSGETYVALAPREQIKSVPYAVRAATSANSDQLGGVSSSQYVTGSSNTFIRNSSSQQSGSFNVSGIGTASTLNATTQFNLNSSRILSSPGTNNTLVGIGNGSSLTSGFGNTFTGRNTGPNTTTGNRNTFTGSGAGFENIGGSDNSFYGFNSGLRITSGSQNSFFGVSAGSGNLTGSDNSFFGYEAGLLATGSRNTFFGALAGRAITSGSDNTFVGNNVGKNTTTGNHNVMIGAAAGDENRIGSSNILIGYLAGRNTNGNANTLVGGSSGLDNTSGRFNTFLGFQAGLNNESGEKNTAIGANAWVGNASLSFATVIGAEATAQFSNTVQLGRNGADEVRIGKLGAATSTGLCINGNNVLSACSSSRRYKENINEFRSGLSLLKKLRPVSFSWIDGGTLDLGLVAEEVAEVEPLLTTTNDAGQIQGVKYDRISVVLLNAVKEQQDQIEKQRTQIRSQEERLDLQERMIRSLRRLICADKPEAEVCRVGAQDR